MGKKIEKRGAYTCNMYGVDTYVYRHLLGARLPLESGCNNPAFDLCPMVAQNLAGMVSSREYNAEDVGNHFFHELNYKTLD